MRAPNSSNSPNCDAAQAAPALTGTNSQLFNRRPRPRNAREHVHAIGLDDIVVPPERMRKLRPEKVDELAESIGRGELIQPIILRYSPGEERYTLVSGHHRLEAAKKLNHKTIHAIVRVGLDADQALLAEIDENLVRADLTSAERASHIAKRKEVYEKLHPETKVGATGRGRSKVSQVETPNPAFIDDTAKKTGKGRSTVARDVTRAKKVKVLAEIAGTPLDKGDEIDALAKRSEDEQRKLAESAKAGEPVTAKPAAKAPPAQPQPGKAVASRDHALFDFSARVLDLVRKIGDHDPARFAKASVKADDLTKVGQFLIAVAEAKRAPAHANGGAS